MVDRKTKNYSKYLKMERNMGVWYQFQQYCNRVDNVMVNVLTLSAEGRVFESNQRLLNWHLLLLR
jgi:hypothetical protein